VTPCRPPAVGFWNVPNERVHVGDRAAGTIQRPHFGSLTNDSRIVVRLSPPQTRSISVGSSAGAFELLTRFDTGQRCNTSSAAGWSSSMPARPFSHGSKSFSASRTGMRSCTSATNLFGSAMILVHRRR
jgi:hypothetical protein